MPTNGYTEICPGVEFKCIAREWRCKWTEDDESKSLYEAQKLLNDMKTEICEVVYDWVGAYARGREVMNDKQMDVSNMFVQQLIDPECFDFKVIVKLPMEHFSAWEAKNFAPEEKFLKALRKIEGITNVETQTYTFENVNLMGKIKVPKAANGCMASN
mmetsp:Transcript_14754/g.30876  ORF Transcript_14754/g.30876 Transcript_14754/m.30876 type:complete len:158 (-) Transcript_14754:249-722(-)